jgi:membrane-anchored protein YejM (alkaline phosphatase superfamily)
MSVAILLLSPTIIEGTNLRPNLKANIALKVALGKIINLVEFLRGFSAWQLTKLPSSAKPKDLTRPLTLRTILTFLMLRKKQD